MNNVLMQIITRKKEDLYEQKKLVSFTELKKQNAVNILKSTFFESISKSVNNPAIIAEVKFASPSAGNIADSSSLTGRIKAYDNAGADAISVITEPHFFKGSLEFLKIVKEKVSLPVLMKDFIIDEYQIYEAALAGPDGLLLIARILDQKSLADFVDKTLTLGIEPVVEVYSDEDLEKAVISKTRFIAVNSRDLDTFELNLDKACSILQKIPDKFIRLGFSGIESANEVSQYKKAGARGVLVGTSLMRSNNVKGFLHNLQINNKTKDQRSKIKNTNEKLFNNIKVKICGIGDLESALEAIDAGADFIGFNFVKSSKRYIEPEKAKIIISKILKRHDSRQAGVQDSKKVKIVGVFQNEKPELVIEITKLLQLDYVQLHGREDEEYLDKIKCKVIKKFSMKSQFSNTNLKYLLLDREKQGEGEMVNLDRAREIANKFPIFLAGGLTPENVAEIIKKVKPFAVDVAGGVETEGKKDYAKLKEFINNAKGISL